MQDWKKIIFIILPIGIIILFISAPLDCLRKREKKSESILIGSSGVGSWTAITTTNAPEGRWKYTTVWTGSEMIIWGGTSTLGGFNTIGNRYNPNNDTWAPITNIDVPLPRVEHRAVWTGSEMIIRAGWNGSNFLQDGALYNPVTNIWTPTIMVNAPTGRTEYSAVWTGNEMIIWGGGWTGTNYPNDGAKYRSR